MTLLNEPPMHLKGSTIHARKGTVKNTFKYGVDFLMIDPDQARGTGLFSRNRWNLFSIHDRHHGGTRGQGTGAKWARTMFRNAGLEPDAMRLLAQPSFLGFHFNPVSFWLAYQGDVLRAVIAEVNNTFGDRHCYLCHLADFAPITAQDRISARKVFHVSPFQDVAGTYQFAFNIRPNKIAIRIDFGSGKEGLLATLSGTLSPVTQTGLVTAALRRPFGALRVLALIYVQALRLKLKGARYRNRPAPPKEEITSC